MGSGLNKFKRCSEKSDIFKGNYICYTGLLKLIVYSRAVCTTKISNTKGRAPFEYTNSLRSCFASFITHHGTFCSFICLSASSYRKSRKNKRNENVSCRCIISCFLAIQSPLSFANTFRIVPVPMKICIVAIFLPLPSLWKCQPSGCPYCLSLSKTGTAGLNDGYLCTTETSFVSIPW